MSAELLDMELAVDGPELVDLASARPVALGLTADAQPRSAAYEAGKRLTDIVLATIGLGLASPILLVAAVILRLTSPGPVLFRQVRVGRWGEVFVCYKFRTMVKDAEVILHTDPSLGMEFRRSYKLPNDPRITPVGKWLRKLSIDELPQLWNVLLGDMSIVGPRPVPFPELCEMYGDDADRVISVKPGLTGLWQVSGRCDLAYDERIRLDLQYVEESSMWMDAKIIARTPLALLGMRGAV